MICRLFGAIFSITKTTDDVLVYVKYILLNIKISNK